jgi:RNA polymerase sigma-70 factor (ECF subfamily)
MNRPMMTANAPGNSRELVGLLDGIARGERAALAALYQRTSAKLYGVCLRLLGSEEDAQDALQDAYATVWQKAARFDASKASPITWLCVVARNKAIDRLRQRPVAGDDLEMALAIPDSGLSALELVEQAQESDRLLRCLEELEERSRAMIRAAFLDGASYSQLAERESVPLGTMKSWIRRGLLRLRGCLER